jgi:peptidoglycan/LPS O-acetylase OafA/YrhL
MVRRGQELAPLTSFRFFCALVIFFYHMHLFFHWQVSFLLLGRLVTYGSLFMTAFFVLSGFILSYAFKDANFFLGDGQMKQYFYKRFARIYPAFFVVHLLSFGLIVHLSGIKVALLSLVSLLMLTAWMPEVLDLWLNAAMWSLSAEAFFYVLFPWLHYVFKFGVRTYYWLALMAYLLCVLPGMMHLFLGPISSVYVSPLFRLGAFILGMITYQFYERHHTEHQDYSLYLLALLFVFIAGVGLLSCVFVPDYITCFDGFVAPIFCGMIYLLACLSVTHNTILYQVLASRWLCYLGRISYAFYLTQLLTLKLCGVFLFHLFPGHAHINCILLLACNLLLAMALYHGVERPCRRYFLGYAGEGGLLRQASVMG